ncbi:phage tail protein [Gloeobacter kilaueensis]|uniref:Phage tail protein n=1 Tax=Gloeobacter kilaueensis (strain ATCC BAA-2537 / CCAP 1431/1 / ULC 316 / JS1) TaxID=1183438 RepID=U5QPN4_GLOK1|nr:phage tail protein [Gloeobacter kilaueensis]AGY59584.1 hypothetical protein GKIL_3338 [Gloeobacter kilaueensis JS1]
MIDHDREFLVSCRFYWSATGIEQRPVLEVKDFSYSNTIASKNTVLGAGKPGGMLFGTPIMSTNANKPYTITVVMCKDNAIQRWMSECAKQWTSTGNTWSKNRKTSTLCIYDQSGNVVSQFEYVDCVPSDYKIGSAKASSGDVMTETFTIHWREMTCVGREAGTV